MRPRGPQLSTQFSPTRVRLWYGLLLVVFTLFIVRLFYLQVIHHDHYRQASLQGQLKVYEIPAERGFIEAHDGSVVVPIVLNEEVYTLFADPVYVKDTHQAASAIQAIIGVDVSQYE